MLTVPGEKEKNTGYSGGMCEPFALPTGISADRSRTDVEEESVIGALIREPAELVRYTIPVPVLGLGRIVLPAGEASGLSGGGERGTDGRGEDEDTIDGTGTAARSPPPPPTLTA